MKHCGRHDVVCLFRHEKKPACRVRDRSEYNASPRQRGSGAIWVSPEAVENWAADELARSRALLTHLGTPDGVKITLLTSRSKQGSDIRATKRAYNEFFHSPQNLQKGFFDRNDNFREILFPISHHEFKHVCVAEMLDDASRAADANQP